MVYRAVVLVVMALGSAVAGCPTSVASPRVVGTGGPSSLIAQAPAAAPDSTSDSTSDSAPDSTPDADADAAPPEESPAEAPSGENPSSDADSASPNPAPASDPRRPWLPLGFGVLGAVLTLSSGVLLVRRRRQAATDDDAPTSDPSPVGPGRSTTNGNGKAANTTDWDQEGDLTPRLLSVNIVHDLLNDLASPDTNRRRQAIWALGQKGHSEAVQPLVDAMLEADSQERGLILAALAEIGVYTLKPMTRALSLSLQDASPDVRKNAIRDFTRLSDLLTQMSQLLQYASQDSDPEVQATAQWALAQLGRVAPPSQVLPQGSDGPSVLPSDPS